MAKTIDIGSVSGIDEAIKYLKRYEKADEKVEKVAADLIDEGLRAAQDVYPSVVSLSKVDEKGMHSLIAEHEAIAFIEFGAGWGVNADNEFARAPGAPDVAVGSWSDQHGGEFSRTGYKYWHFGGKKYTEVPARPGMEAARQRIMDIAEKRLKEEFSHD